MARPSHVPRTLKTFLANGIDPVKCSICLEQYSVNHVAVRIRGCGHEFGKGCLETWLQQSNKIGTCPYCRDVLFKNDRRTIDPVALEDMRRQFLGSGRQTRFAQGRVLRLLDICHPDGLLMRLWRNMRDGYGTQARESQQHAWSGGIRGLLLALFQGTWPAGSIHDKYTLVMYRYFPYQFDIFRIVPTSTPATCPFDALCRNFIRLSRLFPSLQNPTPILLRALVMFQIRNRGVSMAITLQDIDDDLLKAGPRLYSVTRDPDWRTPVSRLYLLLMLMSHDREYNLRFHSPRVYNAADVAKLLRLLYRPIFFDDPTFIAHFDPAFCERAARFYHLSEIGQSMGNFGVDLLDPCIGRRTICTHIQGLWASSETPFSEPWDSVTGNVDYSSDSEDEDGFADWERARSEMRDLISGESVSLHQRSSIVYRTALRG